MNHSNNDDQIFYYDNKVVKKKDGSLLYTSGFDLEDKKLSPKKNKSLLDKFLQRVYNRTPDYVSSSRSYAWGEIIKKHPMSKIAKYALKTKVEAAFYGFGLANDLVHGEKPLQAFVSSSLGFAIAFGASESLGPAGIVLGPEIYELVNDGTDAFLFGDKKKQRRFQRIENTITKSFLKNQKTFANAAKFYSPMVKTGLKGIGKFGKQILSNAAKIAPIAKNAIVAGAKGIGSVAGKAALWAASLFGKKFGFGGGGGFGGAGTIGKFHSGGVVPGRGEIMALLKGGETVRTEAQERAIQEELMRRNSSAQNEKERNTKDSLLPRLSKEDEQYVINIIADAFKRNRYGFRNMLRGC